MFVRGATQFLHNVLAEVFQDVDVCLQYTDVWPHRVGQLKIIGKVKFSQVSVHHSVKGEGCVCVSLVPCPFWGVGISGNRSLRGGGWRRGQKGVGM